MNPIAYLILQIGSLANSLLGIYAFILFIYILLNLLVQLGMMNAYKPRFRGITIGRILSFLNRWYEPPLRAIRRYVPGIGGMDLSPLVFFLALQFAGYTIWWLCSRVALFVG